MVVWRRCFRFIEVFELNYHKEKKITNDGQKIFKKMFPNKIIDELQMFWIKISYQLKRMFFLR